MKSGTSTAGTKTVFVSRTRMILISPDSLDIRIFSGFRVRHFALPVCVGAGARKEFLLIWLGDGELQFDGKDSKQ